MDGWQQDHYKWKHPIRVAKMRPYFEIPTAHLCHRFHPGAFIVAFLTTEDSIFYNPNMWKPREARKKKGERIHHLGTDCVLNVVERVIDIPPSHNDHLDLVRLPLLWLHHVPVFRLCWNISPSLSLSAISSNPDSRLRRSAAVTTASTTCGVCDYIYLSAVPGTKKENWKWLFVTCLLGK